MPDTPDLTRCEVLVVEDEYYIATDTAAALARAGATVLGPCRSVDAAFELLESHAPTHAVLDLNVGGDGPNFEVARALQARRVRFLFMTGYGAEVIPAELRDVVRLQKPVPVRRVVEAVARL